MAPEKHTVNARAFRSMDAADPAFRSYCQFVAIELLLKDYDPALYSHRHDIFSMISARFPNNARLNAVAIAVATSLAKLWCSGLAPKTSVLLPMLVSSKKYPDLRYVRRASDFSSNASSDADVELLLAAMHDLIEELKNEGIK